MIGVELIYAMRLRNACTNQNRLTSLWELTHSVRDSWLSKATISSVSPILLSRLFSISLQAGHSRCLTQLTPILPGEFFRTNYFARQQHNGEETIFECRSSKMKEVTNSRTHQICHCANEEDSRLDTMNEPFGRGTKTGRDWVTHTTVSQSVDSLLLEFRKLLTSVRCSEGSEIGSGEVEEV